MTTMGTGETIVSVHDDTGLLDTPQSIAEPNTLVSRVLSSPPTDAYWASYSYINFCIHNIRNRPLRTELALHVVPAHDNGGITS